MIPPNATLHFEVEVIDFEDPNAPKDHPPFQVKKTHETNGPQVPKGSVVKVHYTGMLTNGQVFDSSVQRGQPLEFKVGMGQVIKGWDEGILQLRKGEKALLICPPDYAYGSRGAGGVIPPNATLHFEVEVIDFK